MPINNICLRISASKEQIYYFLTLLTYENSISICY